LGFTHAIFNMPNVYEITPLEMFGKEIIRLRRTCSDDTARPPGQRLFDRHRADNRVGLIIGVAAQRHPPCI